MAGGSTNTPKQARASAKADDAGADAAKAAKDEAAKILDKPMAPNQDPPIKRDTDAARQAELDRQHAVEEAVALANEGLRDLGGNSDTMGEA